MIAKSRLIHRVNPYPDELIIGFLMRVALKNHLVSPVELIQYFSDGKQMNFRFKDIAKLAYFCRNTTEEIGQLSGFEFWENGEPRWLIMSEWVTMSLFITSRSSRVCPLCLKEEPYLRALWILSFYFVCARHNVLLIDKCPSCNRKLNWDRKRPTFCVCGQPLSEVHSEIDQSNALVLAKILAYRVSQDSQYLSGLTVPIVALEKLANLSLDGICKTIWFLGHCVAGIGKSSLGHGRKKPNVNDLVKMVETTIHFLSRWPDGLGSWLFQILVDEFDINFTSTERRKILGPTDHYVRNCMLNHELQFLVKAYDQYLQFIWQELGSRNSFSTYEKQLLLEF